MSVYLGKINNLTPMRPLRKFLQLTRKTYPSGHEKELESYLPKGYKVDAFGNYYIQVGKSRTLFTCHLDTADCTQKNVNHEFEEGHVITDGNSILGADDKAGMVVMLYMIEKEVPGCYFFFLAEEVGCQGSKKLAKYFFNQKESKKWETYPFDRVISFDRRGTKSIITHQMYSRCCSEEFAEALSKQLNDAESTFKYSPDDTGVVTDSAQFMELIPECTNISVGYYDEHTYDESQDITHLQNLCRASVKVDWESLPVKRDPNFIEEEEDDDLLFDTYLTYGYYDKDKHVYNEWSATHYTKVINKDGDNVKAYISKTWIAKEVDLIKKMLNINDYNSIDWNGNTCWGNTKEGSLEFIGTRAELINYIPELEEIPVEHIREELPTKVVPGSVFKRTLSL
jgi:hypothetical protein